jgi:hypothetical protein
MMPMQPAVNGLEEGVNPVLAALFLRRKIVNTAENGSVCPNGELVRGEVMSMLQFHHGALELDVGQDALVVVVLGGVVVHPFEGLDVTVELVLGRLGERLGTILPSLPFM